MDLEVMRLWPCNKSTPVDFPREIRQTGMCWPWGTLFWHCFKIDGFTIIYFNTSLEKTTIQRTVTFGKHWPCMVLSELWLKSAIFQKLLFLTCSKVKPRKWEMHCDGWAFIWYVPSKISYFINLICPLNITTLKEGYFYIAPDKDIS